MACFKEGYAADTGSEGRRPGERHVARLLAELRQEKPLWAGRAGNSQSTFHQQLPELPALASCSQLQG